MDRNDFHVGGDVVLAAEVEHLLRFGDAANRRTGKTAASEDETESGDGQRFLGSADQGDIAVAREQVDVGIDVVLGGDAIEDEVEAPACFCISSALRETTASSVPRATLSFSDSCFIWISSPLQAFPYSG